MIEAILGNICYPKSEALIIPSNTKGIMSQGIPKRIIKDGHIGIFKEVQLYIEKNKIEVGQCFTSGSGRLKRRGCKRIYHAVIKRLQSDFTSIYIVRQTLNNTVKKVVKDKAISVAICGLGIEDGELDPKTIARITVEICNRYKNKIKIKIIDNNKEFIEEVKILISPLALKENRK